MFPLVRVAQDQGTAGRLKDEFVVGEVELDLARTTERPDIADQEWVFVGENELR